MEDRRVTRSSVKGASSQVDTPLSPTDTYERGVVQERGAMSQNEATTTAMTETEATKSRTSRNSSSRRRAELLARMEIAKQKAAQAQAEAEAAQTRLELIRLQESDDDLSDEETDRTVVKDVGQWVNAAVSEHKRHEYPTTAKAVLDEENLHRGETMQASNGYMSSPIQANIGTEERLRRPGGTHLALPCNPPANSSNGEEKKNDTEERSRRVGGTHQVLPCNPPADSSNGEATSFVQSFMQAVREAVKSASSPASSDTHQTKMAPKYLCELHPFTGEPSEWIAFRATYEDTEKYFSDIENVGRLRRAVTGRAREAVKSTLFCSINPQLVMQSLERLFGQPKRLIKHEIAIIERMAPLAEDGRNLTVFAGIINNAVNTIQQMKKNTYLDSEEIAERVIDKLTNIYRVNWFTYRAQHKNEPIMIALRNYLNTAVEHCDAYEPEAVRKREPPRTRELTRTHEPTRTRGFIRKPVHMAYADYEEQDDDSFISDYEEDDCEEIAPVNIAIASDDECAHCREKHHMKKCEKFLKLDTQRRWEAVRKANACFRCLSTKHRHMSCKARSCSKDGCRGRHHELLHNDRKPTVQPAALTITQPTAQHATPICLLSSWKTYMKIAPVEIIGPNGTMKTFALFDEGSSITLIREDIAAQIGETGPAERLTMKGVTAAAASFMAAKLKVRIRGLYQREFSQMEAYTVPELSICKQSVKANDISEHEYLSDISDQLVYDDAEPPILIGQDNWHLIVTRELRQGNTNQPVASFTQLGWVLHGIQSDAPQAHVNHISRTDQLTEMIQNHFAIESLGIAPKTPANDPEKRALETLNATTERLSDGSFSTGLIWKSQNETMPQNRDSALQRFQSIERKMNKNDNFKAEYTKQINNLMENGYAEEICTPPVSPRAWYLPHFAVTHPQKGKIRLVFDAAAKTNGTCLNDALLAGPDLLQSLFAVLLQFREGPIAVVAEIKEMFLRVKIRPEDRDSLRFLWRDNPNEHLREYRMTSLIFGAASSPCTAIYIKNKNAREQEDADPRAVRAIEKNHYMDDYLQSFHNLNEAKAVAKEVDRIHKKASFHLRGWASNKPEILSDFPDELRSTEDIMLGDSNDPIEKTLGLKWNLRPDCLNFALNLRNTPPEAIDGHRPPTKREVTSAVMSVFDPLGLASPILIQGKTMLQQVWRSGVDWDELLQPSEEDRWRNWLCELEKLQDLNIPRCISPTQRSGQLHIFCDASEQAYATAAYWRTESPDGSVNTHLVAAKARVAPLKPVSIPRLELQAALMGCRLASSINDALQLTVESITFWTDSRTVLAWIKSCPRTFKPFVAHRLAEIEETTTPKQWRWVPTKENVADDATRQAPANFTSTHRWFKGPTFLSQKTDTWPVDKSEPTKLEPTGEEKEAPKSINVLATCGSLESPDPSRFSKWQRLVRATARFLQCVDVFKSLRKTVAKIDKDPAWRQRRPQPKPPKLKLSPKTPPSADLIPLETEYLNRAEITIYKRIQAESFTDDIQRLKDGRSPDKGSRLRRLVLLLSPDKLLRLSTRVQAADYLGEEYKQPIVLDGRHHTTKLLVRHFHEKFNHANHHTVMNELRQRFYILALRSTLRALAHSCVTCKCNKSTPQTVPQGNLPPERMQRNQRPFTHAAVDYFGPMTVTVGRRHEKRWGALFTCLTTRAVHIELADSLGPDAMILALRRMSARRGTPKTLYSDNGSNFVKANKEITKELEKACQAKQIEWKFIPPGAPSMGGAWERMVRSVKVALTATLKEKTPPHDVLHTLLLEVEHLINSRPLVGEVSLDPDEPEELTPNHFLIGRSCGTLPVGNHAAETLTKPSSWKVSERLTDYFWSRWTKEYLPTIALRANTDARNYRNPEIGDVVLITDTSTPRGTWPKGRIIQTHTGPDEITRIVTIRTNTGEFRRPTSRVIVLVPGRGTVPSITK